MEVYAADLVEVRGPGARLRELSQEALKASLTELLGQLAEVLDGIPTAVGGWTVDQITVGATITASGRLALVGIGAEAQASLKVSVRKPGA